MGRLLDRRGDHYSVALSYDRRCTVGWQAENKSFLCPCHDTRFAESGELQSGPAERGLDPLPIEVRDGRLQLTWIRYKLDIKGREPV